MPDPPRSDARIEAVLSQLSHAANLGISPEELLKRAMDGLLQVTRAPAGVTKWSAIHRLAQGWGIDDEAICAVGDDVNDIPMIRAAGLGVAMGNALDEVKAIADYVTLDVEHSGLAAAIERFLL